MRHDNNYESNCGGCECDICANPKKFRPQLASCSGPYSCAPISHEWDYMVNNIPNRTKEGETRIVTEASIFLDSIFLKERFTRRGFQSSMGFEAVGIGWRLTNAREAHVRIHSKP